MWIEMFAGLFAYVLHRFLLTPGWTIGTVRRQGIPHVYDGKYPCGERYLFAFQSARIAGPIPFFVVTEGNIKRGAKIFNWVDHIVGILWVFLHDNPFFV